MSAKTKLINATTTVVVEDYPNQYDDGIYCIYYRRYLKTSPNYYHIAPKEHSCQWCDQLDNTVKIIESIPINIRRQLR